MSKPREDDPIAVGVLTRALPDEVAKPSVNQDDRTIRIAFTSRDPVERWMWSDELPEGASSLFDEVIPSEKKYWNLERVTQKVCPYLKNHDRFQKLGRVVSVDFDGTFGYATVKLRKTPEADQFLTDVTDDLGGGTSYGYVPREYRVVTPAEWEYDKDGWGRKLVKKAVLEATDVELYEISSEEIPASFSIGSAGGEKGLAHQSVSLRSVVINGDPNFLPEQTTRDSNEMPGEKDDKELIQLRSENDRLQTQLRAAEDDRDNFKKQLGAKEQEITSLNIDLQGRSAEVEKLNTQLSERDAALAEKEASIAAFQKRSAVTANYTKLRSQADDLLSEAKVTAAEYERLFGEVDADIEKYCTSERSEQELSQITFYLGMAATRAPQLPLGTKTGDEKLKTPVSERTEDEETVKQRAAKRKQAEEAISNAWRNG